MYKVIQKSEKINWTNKKYQGTEIRGVSTWKAQLKSKLEATNETWILEKDAPTINYNHLKEAKEQLEILKTKLISENKNIYGNTLIKNNNVFIHDLEEKIKSENKAANACITCIENEVGITLNINIRNIKDKTELTKRQQLEQIVEMINTQYKPNLDSIKIAIQSDLDNIGYATNYEQIYMLMDEINILKQEMILESQGNEKYHFTDEQLKIKLFKSIPSTGIGEKIRNNINLAEQTWNSLCKSIVELINTQIKSNEDIANEMNINNHSNNNSQVSSATIQRTNRDISKVSCYFYKKGRCNQGDSCKYLHENNENSNNNSNKNLMPKCFQYYYKGNCNRGDKCKFSHSEIENNSKRPENNGFNYSQKKRKNNTVDTNQNNSDTE